MSHSGVCQAIWHIQAVLTKGPHHLLSLGRWYAIQAAQRARGVWSPAKVDESAFLTQLTLPGIGQALSNGDLEAAKTMVADHYRNRAQPVFCFDPFNMQVVNAEVDDTAQKHTIDRAEEVCRHTFQFRGEAPVVFNESVDWFHCPHGNLDWTWELNRHAYFVTLGRAYAYTRDVRYVHKFRDLLLDWLTRNPVGVDRPNWGSVLEVAYRVNTWLWAYHYFLAVSAFDDETLLTCLRGLWIHGRYLATNLEYHVPNNHLLLESKALAMLGLLFPEFKDAGEWLRRGLSILWQQVRRQVGPDGVHGEQAIMYHQVITSELLEMLVLLENNGLATPTDVLGIFARMLDFERAITKPDGQIPLIGDSALGDSYLRFSTLNGGAALLGRDDLTIGGLDEATLWLVGSERVRWLRSRSGTSSTSDSRAFPDGGYFVMRHGNGQGSYLIFDCGPFGYPPAPGHGHADALSFELYAGGRTLIVDPGVYNYHLGAEWRNYFRSTAAHNTLVVDSLDQSLLVGLWHVLRPAQATLHEWITAEQFDLVSGSHDGYTRLGSPITHRRYILFVKPEYWIVLDLLNGQGEHRFDLYFHLAPDAQVSLDSTSGTAWVRHVDGVGLMICPVRNGGAQAQVITGSLDPIQGWVSQYSGEKRPAPALRYSQVTTAPARFGTMLYPRPQMDQASVSVLPLTVMDERSQVLGEHAVTGLKIEADQWVDYVIIDHRARPGRKVFGSYITDGELVYLRQHSSEGKPVKAFLHRGRELRLDGRSLIEY